MNMKKTLLASAIMAATSFHPLNSRAAEAAADINSRATGWRAPLTTGQPLPHGTYPRVQAGTACNALHGGVINERLPATQLQLEVMFDTGEDQLSTANRRALEVLARFLLEHSHLAVRLDGFADPRGTDEYNNVLSEYRARAVQEALMASGIAPERIERRAHGAGLTRATAGDYQSYALERRVDIHIYNPAEQETLASTH